MYLACCMLYIAFYYFITLLFYVGLPVFMLPSKRGIMWHKVYFNECLSDYKLFYTFMCVSVLQCALKYYVTVLCALLCVS